MSSKQTNQITDFNQGNVRRGRNVALFQVEGGIRFGVAKDLEVKEMLLAVVLKCQPQVRHIDIKVKRPTRRTSQPDISLLLNQKAWEKGANKGE